MEDNLDANRRLHHGPGSHQSRNEGEDFTTFVFHQPYLHTQSNPSLPMQPPNAKICYISPRLKPGLIQSSVKNAIVCSLSLVDTLERGHSLALVLVQRGADNCSVR